MHASLAVIALRSAPWAPSSRSLWTNSVASRFDSYIYIGKKGARLLPGTFLHLKWLDGVVVVLELGASESG